MAETPRSKALDSLANSFPAANDKMAKGQQAARQLQIQQAVQQGPVGKQSAQTLGAKSAEMAGGIQAEAAKRAQAQNVQIGQMGIAETGRQQRQDIFSKQQAGQKYQNELQQRIFNQDRKAAEEMLDNRLNFNKDELGRTQLNERQLADFAVLQATDSEKLKDFAMYSNQLHDRKMYVMKVVYDKLSTTLEQEHKKSEQEKNQALVKELTAMKTAYEKKMAEDAAKAGNNAAMWGTVGTIAGGIVGGAVGGPGGAMLGASVGGSIGTAVGSNV